MPCWSYLVAALLLFAPMARAMDIRQEEIGDQLFYVVELDLDKENLDLTVLKAKGELFAGAEVERIVEAATARGLQIVAAVNGDFFEADFSPTGMLVTDGMIWKGSASLPSGSPTPRSILAIDAERRVFIGRPDFQFVIRGNAGEEYSVDRINFPESADESTIYTPVFGARTAPLLRGQRQVEFHLEDTTLIPNRMTKATIVSIGPGPTAKLDSDTIVLHLPAPIPDWMAEGEVAELRPTLSNFEGEVPLILGGLPRLIDGGTVDPIRFSEEEEFPITVAEGRYPRTAVGYDPQNKKMYIIVTDGYRSDQESGLTLRELADWFAARGCRAALNLDGGISSTFIGKGRVINEPGRDDSGAFPVGSALAIVAPRE